MITGRTVEADKGDIFLTLTVKQPSATMSEYEGMPLPRRTRRSDASETIDPVTLFEPGGGGSAILFPAWIFGRGDDREFNTFCRAVANHYGANLIIADPPSARADPRE
jgi:hypothetical protein